MERVMKRVFAASLVGLAVFAALNLYLHVGWARSWAITCGTVAYHFGMRLAVGFLFDRLMHNRADCSRRWFQPHPLEGKLHRAIRIKQWKGRVPTYQPDLFSPQKHSWSEIAQAMCQAELVHEANAVLSFVPLLGALLWDSFGVFLVTSLCAALFDLMFAALQRYNRPRVVRLAARESAVQLRP